MTLTTEQATAAHWTEPDGIAPRGTLIVIGGRGEAPELYERFGRRIAGDGYRVHAVADPVADPALSPLTDARDRYAQAPRAELVSIADGVHDVLNDVTHRTVAATIVLFLERLRLGAELAPIAVSEKL
jgi:alpha-beta hydrolase superfamily lysophospholipase